MINAVNFEYADSRLEDLYLFLQKEQVNVYMPGIKIGECTTPYVVVKNGGANKLPGISSNITYYTIMCYVPKQSYSLLDEYVMDIKEKMKKLIPLFRFTGNETISFYDDELKAHMISLSYSNYKKM